MPSILKKYVDKDGFFKYDGDRYSSPDLIEMDIPEDFIKNYIEACDNEGIKNIDFEAEAQKVVDTLKQVDEIEKKYKEKYLHISPNEVLMYLSAELESEKNKRMAEVKDSEEGVFKENIEKIQKDAGSDFISND